jgi:hypothetical protein
VGYYTKYSIFECVGADLAKVKQTIRKVSGYDNFEGECVKWYLHEDDMKKMSLLFPGVTIVLDGSGEDYPDLWRKWFKDGKMKYSLGRVVFQEPANWSD